MKVKFEDLLLITSLSIALYLQQTFFYRCNFSVYPVLPTPITAELIAIHSISLALLQLMLNITGIVCVCSVDFRARMCRSNFTKWTTEFTQSLQPVKTVFNVRLLAVQYVIAWDIPFLQHVFKSSTRTSLLFDDIDRVNSYLVLMLYVLSVSVRSIFASAH